MSSIEDLRRRWNPNNPAAPVDWRFRLAKAYHHRGCRPSFYDDRNVTKLLRFLRALEDDRNSFRRAGAGPDFIDLVTARDLRLEKIPRLRPVVEAYLLSELDDASVASRLGLSAGAVQWFRLTFFDVKHLLAFPVRIVHQVIRTTDESGRDALDLRKLWKLIAFHCGSKKLEEVLTLSSSVSSATGEALDFIASQTQLQVRIKQLLSVGAPGAESRYFPALANLPNTAGDQEGPASRNLISKHVAALLDEIPFAAGDDGKKQFAGTEIGAFDESAVELRASELMVLAAGEKVPGLDDYRGMELPPPRERSPEAGSSGSVLDGISPPQKSS